MSTTIDRRVVEMRFDNKQFEKNTRETMSTLDKLKQKLNFKGAAKGLENINTSANKVNMKGLSGALETVSSRFSAMEVIGITALANITNSAVNAGKRMVSALTLDPITTGFKEYETQINAVQTILANTQKEGTNIEMVNAALDELNKYADMTIYNFTEMTRNIGTFTAAGVKLDDSVSAIKGIANLAAVSGSTSQQASTAMYQLSQAMASGTVKLMDWNSVVNAGMGGQVFQDALMETARVHGIAIDEMIADEGSFRDTLQLGWLTTDILTETLNKFTYASDQMTEAEKERTKAMLLSQGYTEEQIEGIFQLGNTATDAATKVKTFTQLWDVLKEAAQSGWAQSWRTIVGDFEEAKALLTPLADFLTGIINGFSEARNKILESAFGKSFKGLLDGINDTTKGIQKAVDSVKDYAKVVDSIISGDWGNGQARWDKLAEAGYDWAHAQNLVNEKLGNSYRRATNYKEAQEEVEKTQEKATEVTTDFIISLTKMSDAELKAKGYTDEQIASLRELVKVSKKTGIPLKEFIENLDDINGRYLFMNSFKNIGLSMVSIFKSIGTAWKNAFPPITGDQLFNVIAGMHKLSTVIRTKVEKNADKLTRTLKGLFAIIDLISMVVGGGLKLAFTILKAVLGAFNLNILDLTAIVGDAIVAFRDWVEENNLITKGIQKIIPWLVSAAKAVKNWVVNNETIAKTIDKIQTKLQGVTKGIRNWIKGLKETDNVPKYILEGLVNGLKTGASVAIETIIGLGKGLIEGIKKILGIHSPSKVFFAIGGFIIAGLVLGLQNGFDNIWETLGNFKDGVVEFVRGIDFGAIFSALIAAGFLATSYKLASAFEKIASPFESFGELMQDIGSSIRSVSKGISTNLKANAFKSLATAIAILVGSVVVLTMLDPKKTAHAVGIITVLAGVMLGLTIALDKLTKTDIKDGDVKKQAVSIGKICLLLVGMSLSLLIVSSAVKKIGGLSWEEWARGIGGVAILFVAFLAVIKLASKMDKDVTGLGGSLLKISAAILLMVYVAKSVAKLSVKEIHSGIAALTVFGLFVLGFMKATKLLSKKDNVAKVGKTILQIAGALLLMVWVTKAAGKMSEDEIKKGFDVMLMFATFILGFMAVTKLISGSKNVDKIGGAIIKIAGAMALMALVVNLLAFVSEENLKKGIVAIAAFGLVIAGLMAATKLITGSKNVDKIGKTLLMISVSIAILAGVAALLSLIREENLRKGIVAVGLLSVMMAGLIAVTKFAKKSVGTITALTVAVGILATAIILLSFIDPTKLMGASVALGIVMGMFALMAASTKSVTKAWGTVLAMSLLIGVLGVALYALAKLPIQSTLASAAALSLLLLALSATCLICSVIPVAAAVQGALGLAAFIGIMAALLAVLGALSKIPGLKELVEDGGEFLASIGYALGKFVGSIAGGFGAGVTSGLPEMGQNLSDFMKNATPFIDGAKSLDKSLLEGVKTLAAAILAITASNFIESISSLFTGKDSFEKFGTKLAGLGQNLKAFVENLGTFTEDKITAVDNACKALESIAKLAKLDLKDAGKDMGKFGEKLVKFAGKVAEFVNAMTNTSIADIGSAANKIKELTKVAQDVSVVDTKALNNFTKSLKKVSKDGVKGFIENISGTSPKEDTRKAVRALMSAVIEGAESKRRDVEKQFKAIAKAAIDALDKKSYKNDAKDIGKDFAKGFANGIKNNKSLARDAGSELGRAALNAAKKAIDAHSPSREAFKLGEFFDQGFIGGIKSLASNVYDTSHDMANNAKEGLSKALTRVSDLITNDMDTQPTIRPVLDLSEVQSGADYLNSMFNNGPSIGVMSNLSAISSGVNARLQNGTNDDVVSAINKLGKNLGGMGGNTYNINGVSANGDNSVEEAVQTIVRAAIMERRT